MKIRKVEILSFFVVLATFVVAVLVYPQMPDRIVSHWGINGEANDQMGKFWGVFLLPTITLICYLILTIIPRTDPKKQNIQKFQKYYDLFILAFTIFFVYVYMLTIFWNLNYHFVFMQFLTPALAILFYIVGIMFKYVEPNLSIGIRTPWTIANDDVWHKTHKLGSKLFKIAAFICLLGIIMPQYALYFVLLPIIIASLYLVLYSYLEYRKTL
jgi:uncharacterized membrane protein